MTEDLHKPIARRQFIRFIACRDRETLRRLRSQFEALRAGEELPSG